MNNDRNLPKTAVLEIRIDLRTVATIATFFESKDNLPSSKGRLLVRAITAFEEILVCNKLVERETSTAKALEILKGFGLIGWNRGGRNLRSLYNQLEVESILEEVEIGKENQTSPTETFEAKEAKVHNAEEVLRKMSSLGKEDVDKQFS